MNLQAQVKERIESAKGSCKGKTSEMGQVDNDDISWIHEEWSPDESNGGCSSYEFNDDRNCVGWREACEQMCRVSVSSLSLESSESAKMNLDPRTVINTW